jgi:hypothetical protein
MIKKITTVASLLFSMFVSAQTTTKIYSQDIRGVSCKGGLGRCVTDTITANKTNNMKNFNVIKLSPYSMILEIDLNNLSVENQKLFFGKEYAKIAANEQLVFLQDQDFIFDINTILYLDLDPGYRLLKRGSYPLAITKDKVHVTLALSPYR